MEIIYQVEKFLDTGTGNTQLELCRGGQVTVKKLKDPILVDHAFNQAGRRFNQTYEICVS